MIKEQTIKNRPKEKIPKEVRDIEFWFKTEYLITKAKIERYKYLGLECDITRHELEKEAYEKEQRYRSLLGLEPLPELKKIKLL